MEEKNSLFVQCCTTLSISSNKQQQVVIPRGFQQLNQLAGLKTIHFVSLFFITLIKTTDVLRSGISVKINESPRNRCQGHPKQFEWKKTVGK